MSELILTPPLEEIILRGNDPSGHGNFGAKRGLKKHAGVDLAAVPGVSVFSPIDGIVTKFRQVYSHTTEFKIVEITNDIYRAWLMYCAPDIIEKNDRVYRGDRLGVVQDISSYWWNKSSKKGTKMINHLHVQIWKYGKVTDPEPLLINYFKDS